MSTDQQLAEISIADICQEDEDVRNKKKNKGGRDTIKIQMQPLESMILIKIIVIFNISKEKIVSRTCHRYADINKYTYVNLIE